MKIKKMHNINLKLNSYNLNENLIFTNFYVIIKHNRIICDMLKKKFDY